jgi:mono/diheme cytochrome c family protein
MTMKIKSIIYLFAITLLALSCNSGGNNPGREYIPEMIHSVAYDAGSENPVYANKHTNQMPPNGSIAQGKNVYHIPNTPEGYIAASSNTNPFNFSDDEIANEGKKIFATNCAICHGEKGDGQGHLPSIDKFPPPPSYLSEPLLSLPEGQRYHTLVYGKGMMGSFGTQLNHRERWLVLDYVKSLQGKSTPAATSPADSTKKM